MGDRLSRGNAGELLDPPPRWRRRFRAGKVAPLACASSARLRTSRTDLLGDLPRLPAASALTHLLRDGPALGDDGLRILGADGRAVDVADDVGLVALHHRPRSFGQVGGDDAQSTEVALAAL